MWSRGAALQGALQSLRERLLRQLDTLHQRMPSLLSGLPGVADTAGGHEAAGVTHDTVLGPHCGSTLSMQQNIHTQILFGAAQPPEED